MSRPLVQIILAVILLCADKVQAAELSTIPKPQVVRSGKGNFNFPGSKVALRISVAKEAAHATAREEIEQTLREYGEIEPVWQSGGKSVISLGLPGEDSDFAAHVRNLKIWPENRVGDEGYVLRGDRCNQIIFPLRRHGIHLPPNLSGIRPKD